MTTKAKILSPPAQIAALRTRVRKLRREATRKLCPNPVQTLRIAQLLQDIADTIEALLLAHAPRPAVLH